MKKAWFLILFCWGCKSASTTPVIKISLVNHEKSLKISGIDEVILNDIDRDSIKNWESLVAVYKLPADTDLKDYQQIQAGHYSLKESSLIFTPDTPFAKPQAYFLRHYNYGANKTILDYLKAKTSKGQLHYIDLIFKP